MTSRLFATCVAVVAVFTPPAYAQRSVAAVLDALDRVHPLHEASISPEGARVAWVEDLSPDGAASAIYVRVVKGGVPKRISAAADGRPHRERGLAWSPDGQRLAFLSDAAAPPQLQLYVVDVDGGAARRVTSVAGQLAHPLWAPDGKQIAVLFVSGSTQETGALAAYKPDAGVVGDIVEEQRIAIADVALAPPKPPGGEGGLREVSPPNLYVYDYDWSPDSRAFAAEAAEGSGTNNYWIAQLYVIRADTGAAASIWKPPLQLAGPRWSPDGRSIAVIHGIMSDEGATGGDIYIVPAAGGAAKNVTPNLEGSARSIMWQADGRILFNEYVDGSSALARVDASGGARAIEWSAPVQISDVTATAKGDAAAAVVHSFAHPPEVYAGPVGLWNAQSSTNAAVTAMWGEGRSLHWKSDLAAPKGAAPIMVQGWLLYPANFDPAKKYPLVVSVHGGPSSAHYPSWPARWNAVLPSQGYFVLLPNPRGSYGAGEAFTKANVNDLGYGDMRDIDAGVDAAVKAAPIDPGRVGIIGWSYGGYMTMWAVTQSTRYRAAVAGAGIANWQSYYGQNKIDTWMLPFFGASVYDKPEAYSRSSPITFIKKAKTPTLVLHGDRDSEVPTPQGYEFWHALKALNVPTQFVIYPEEGHAIAKPEHQRDIEERLMAWFDRYLTPQSPR
ncbi:MAG: S9 family peptidase [Acidobacteria bacterium]|nr:S9 family peptidase [Acidobacteriota bacterium]